MTTIVFDIETNAFLKSHKLKPTKSNLKRFPFISQIAWVIKDGENLTEKKFYIKPDNWKIEIAHFNGVTQENCENEGIPIVTVLEEFMIDYNQCETLVAHNTEFDVKIMDIETMRNFNKRFAPANTYCTMKNSIELCELPPFRYGSYKFPKLTELYYQLFYENIVQTHDALDDIRITLKCYNELILG